MGRTAISEKGGCFICLWVKNEPLVGPQQSQIGGIETSSFWPTGTSNDVCTKPPYRLKMMLEFQMEQ